MALYYLMETKQIPFLLRDEHEYDIRKHMFKINISLVDNLVGFIKFYSYEYRCIQTKMLLKGKFHSERKIVCLLEKH